MAKKTKNPLLAFFSSVQLALFLLFILAGTSIIGTIIPQNSPPENYIQKYGPEMARFMELLNFTDMYNSWWFLTLLLLFSINLIVCSFERIPQVFAIIRQDNLGIGIDRLRKMSIKANTSLGSGTKESIATVRGLLNKEGWKPEERQRDQGTLLFAEKGAWTRFGVYIVHLSILVILVGAVVGSSSVAQKVLRSPSFAFKGSIMLPETRQSDIIYSFNKGETIDLGFTIRCDYFNIDYYDNGMPKTFLTKATILENNEPVLSTDIKVNTPLTYKGITFYQSSYQPYSDFVVSLKNQAKGIETKTITPASQQKNWDEGGLSYGIINSESRGQVARRVKVWLTDNQGPASTFWVNVGQEAKVERPSGTYMFSAKQLYATGLQVTKDPGVWLVYAGCLLMLVGLYIAFFMSHQKIFVFLHEEHGEIRALFAGSANKNKIGFERKFENLVQSLEMDKSR